MIVVLGIFAFISAVVMGNYAQFGKKTELKNLAYNIALTIREAQVSGLTGRNIRGEGASTSYGVYFEKFKFVFFADQNTNHIYDTGEEKRIYKIPQGFKVSKLCYSYTGNCINTNNLTITFKRPEPDAYIYSGFRGPYPAADIELLSPSGYKLHVIVESSGQISVQKQGL